MKSDAIIRLTAVASVGMVALAGAWLYCRSSLELRSGVILRYDEKTPSGIASREKFLPAKGVLKTLDREMISNAVGKITIVGGGKMFRCETPADFPARLDLPVGKFPFRKDSGR